MASSNPQDSRNPSTPPQSIALQDLSRPPDSQEHTNRSGRNSRGRSLIGGGSHTNSIYGRPGPKYERLGDTSPSPTERESLRPQAAYTSSNTGFMESAIENPAAFQNAIGFSGLSIPSGTSAGSAYTRSSLEADDVDSASPYSNPYSNLREENETYFPSFETDRVPLTDPKYLQPVSGAEPSTPDGHERSSFQSVRFDTPGSTSRTSRLGDDLSGAEAGYGRPRAQSYGASLTPDGRTRSRASSSIAASPISRAGSIVKAMSQRVVNLSNEPAVVAESSRGRTSTDMSRLKGPPSLNLMDEEGFDTQAETFVTAEKPPSVAHVVLEQMQPNPLKGRSLGIFSPESTIRKFLCEVLVHPVTEPAILALIIVQTILLAVDSSPSVYTNPRPPFWGDSKNDYIFMALFSIYTLEIGARVIVSGFIHNASEYSTINRQHGVKAAILEKGRGLFAPQRQASVKQSSELHEGVFVPSIVRSFTTNPTMHEGPEVPPSAKQLQRERLARRAFLRHSFNRLDFLAVVSFWVTFVLSITGREHSTHLYVFRMLSCLRILRLLGLTNGTSVCYIPFLPLTPLTPNADHPPQS